MGVTSTARVQTVKGDSGIHQTLTVTATRVDAQWPQETGSKISFMLQMGKVQFRKVKRHIQSHTATKQQGCDLNINRLTAMAMN